MQTGLDTEVSERSSPLSTFLSVCIDMKRMETVVKNNRDQ